MKPFLSIFLIFIGISILNSAVAYNVNKADSILNARIDSVVNIYNKEVIKLKDRADLLEKYKTQSEAYDQSFMEYGSWVVGIIVGLIILFGAIFNFVSESIVDRKFKAEYNSHTRKFEELIRRCRLQLLNVKIVDKLETDLKSENKSTIKTDIDNSTIS